MDYPLSEDVEPLIDKVLISMIPREILHGNSREALFPDIIDGAVAYHVGSNKKNWASLYMNLIIFCKDHNIQHVVLFWDPQRYLSLDFTDKNWEQLYPKPYNWNPIEKYYIGCHAGIMGTLKETLLFLTPHIPYQVFIGNPKSFAIPKLTVENSTCINIIQQKTMRVYAHLPYLYNLAKADHGPKLKEYLKIATALGMSGAVIHVAKQTTYSREEALKNMYDNIVQAMEPGLCPLLIETPAAAGTEMLTNYREFLWFIHEVNKVHPNFGCCIDTCHVFSSGYDPYHYLDFMIKNNANVQLIHYNDSQYGWYSKADRHAYIGTGKIPWVFLEEVASLASLYSIPMVVE